MRLTILSVFVFPVLIFCSGIALAGSEQSVKEPAPGGIVGGPPVAAGEKRLQLQLKDTLTKENDGTIRVKPEFTLEVNGENGFTVRSLQKEIVGSVSCASCPGGQCRAKLLPPNRGFCVGCNGGACLISPF